MGRAKNLGEFEQLVLLALLRLGEGAYGVTVRRELAGRAGRRASIGAVYATLDRLEAKGYVSSQVGEPTPERGGRAKRCFLLTPAGEAALRRSLGELSAMLDGLELGLGTP